MDRAQEIESGCAMSRTPWREFRIHEGTPAKMVAVVEAKVKHARRGNPNWGRPAPDSAALALQAQPTAFERFVAERQIPEAMFAESRELRLWVGKNFTQRYVPESLLLAYGLNDRVNRAFERRGAATI
jgi:hypothetical protein